MGYIKIDRNIERWGWFDSPSTLCLFIHLLLLANYEDSEYHGKVIPRGSLVTGRRMLSERTGLSEQQIRTALDRLVSTGEVVIESTNANSLITICNYDSYQDRPIDSNQQSTNEQPTVQPTNNPPRNQQTTHGVTTSNITKEIKKEINNNNISTPAREEIDDDSVFSPQPEKNKRFVKPTIDEVRQYGIEKQLTHLDPEAFWYFYESKGWKVGKDTMKNWRSAASGWNSRSESRGDKPYLKATPQKREIKDGKYWKRDFSEEELKDIYSYDFTLRKKLERGDYIERKGGKWVI